MHIPKIGKEWLYPDNEPDGGIHPLAFYSHMLHAVELNYIVYNKELLAIFKVFCS